MTGRAVCGESRTHGSVRAVEGRPSTATLRKESPKRPHLALGDLTPVEFDHENLS